MCMHVFLALALEKLRLGFDAVWGHRDISLENINRSSLRTRLLDLRAQQHVVYLQTIPQSTSQAVLISMIQKLTKHGRALVCRRCCRRHRAGGWRRDDRRRRCHGDFAISLWHTLWGARSRSSLRLGFTTGSGGSVLGDGGLQSSFEPKLGCFVEIVDREEGRPV